MGNEGRTFEKQVFDSDEVVLSYSRMLRNFILMVVAVYVAHILILSLLFAFQFNFEFFAIPTVLCLLIIALMLLMHKTKRPMCGSHRKSAVIINHSHIIALSVGISLIAASLILCLSFVLLVLQQRGFLPLENLQAFLICLSVPFVIQLLYSSCVFFPHIVTCVRLVLHMFDKKDITTAGLSVVNANFFCYALVSSIFSAAMISLTYLRHGSTGIMALPIIASIITQLLFFSGIIMPSYALEEVLKRKDNDTKYALGWLPFKVLGIMLGLTSVVAGSFACLQYGFDVVIFSSLPEFFAFLFIPNAVITGVVLMRVIKGFLGFRNVVDYAVILALNGLVLNPELKTDSRDCGQNADNNQNATDLKEEKEGDDSGKENAGASLGAVDNSLSAVLQEMTDPNIQTLARDLNIASSRT